MSDLNNILSGFEANSGELEPYLHEIDEVEQLLVDARTLPKIPADDPRVREYIESGESLDTVQFGNNFYLLWVSLQNPNPDSIIFQIYGQRAQAIPGWSEFIDRNKDVVNEMNRVITEVYTPMADISSILLDYINQGRFDIYERFKTELDHPLGFTAAEYFAWDHMNASLSSIASRMDAEGIVARQFFG